ncbi:lens fiber membrane intrinsic protein isoform X1 [Gallus gallus]|uniref:lens fiber membrane intrinsic protein isoform X1 n=1 Tax=Gallus gallus TaxID=9031 RepID=UPI001AE75BBA|nr:lens fiber membrane intrinsic protein isoform X1 [Gallus gallus]XP_046788660.1 lens fiber membrane intrinsic protein isoform X1 [Gallus gallus]
MAAPRAPTRCPLRVTRRDGQTDRGTLCRRGLKGRMAAGGLLCAASGLCALLGATATDFWLSPRGRGDAVGLWRFCTAGGHCRTPPGQPAIWDATRALMLLAVLAAAVGFAVGLSAAGGAAWRARARVAGMAMLLAGALALLGLAVCTAGARGTAWHFSWSYILGWVGVVLIGSAGLFHLCAAAKDLSPESSETGGG